MRKSTFIVTGISLFVLLSSCYLIRQNNSPTVQATENKHKCFPFLPVSQTAGQYQVVGAHGEITQSSHPQLLPPGFGKKLAISSGGYNPGKRQIMLVIRDRYIGLFLKQPLIDNKSVEFIARPCGSVSSFALRVHNLIRPELFFQSDVFKVPCSFPQPETLVCFYFQGTLMKQKNKIQGKFSAQAGFYLTDTHTVPELKAIDPYEGVAQGTFILELKPGRSHQFPEPTHAVTGLW